MKNQQHKIQILHSSFKPLKKLLFEFDNKLLYKLKQLLFITIKKIN